MNNPTEKDIEKHFGYQAQYQKVKGEQGIIKNTCKECGQEFEVLFYEGETEEKAKKDYCLFCIFGIKRIKNKNLETSDEKKQKVSADE